MNRPSRMLALAAAAAVSCLPAGARAGEAAPPAPPASPPGKAGLVVSADLGGGGQIGAGSAYQPANVFELELGFAYEVWGGLAPQVSFVLGMSPGTTFAIRPGLAWYLPDTPFFLRAAVDASTQVGYLDWRWLLLGGGLALRITDVFGFMVEGDSGIPLASGVGVPLLVRAGAFARF